MTDSVNRVSSALTQLLQHIEVSMWAEEIDPERALRVLNRITFGTPYSHPAGRVEGIPDWAEEQATQIRVQARHAVASHLEQDVHSQEVSEGLRMVTLALVRQVLQPAPEPFEQALRSE